MCFSRLNIRRTGGSLPPSGSPFWLRNCGGKLTLTHHPPHPSAVLHSPTAGEEPWQLLHRGRQEQLAWEHRAPRSVSFDSCPRPLLMAPLPTGVQEDRQREAVFMDQEPVSPFPPLSPGPPGFGLSIHRPGPAPSCLGRPQELLGSTLCPTKCKPRSLGAGQFCQREILALLFRTASLAPRPTPARVDAHTLGDDGLAVPSVPHAPTRHCLTHAGKTQLLTTSSRLICRI